MTHHILTVAEMYRADSLAVQIGVSSSALMEAAGYAVAQTICRRFRPCRVAVLCGPGNNGGDGFVIARLLAAQGYVIRLSLYGDVQNLKGDAAFMAGQWHNAVHPLGPDSVEKADLVVDALFGAGLARPLDEAVQDVFRIVAAQSIPVVAVDVPSGVDGDSGAILGCCPQAQITVTFFRKKPGHLLLPGREKCGELVVADIGIPPSVLQDVEPSIAENGPSVWLKHLPIPTPSSHKYNRGHLLVIGGDRMMGAARLAAMSARRVGAGLVTVAAPAAALPVYAAAEPGLLLADWQSVPSLLEDARYTVALAGPGNGVCPATRQHVLDILDKSMPCVLDADALTVFADRPRDLFRALGDQTVLTPHDGEYARLFAGKTGSRLEKARHAAAVSGAVVLVKGYDTVIAHPDGRAVINSNAPPWLATAGSGDVLAGLIAGLMAGGMPAFEAACAASWLHGQCGQQGGWGLIAEDLAQLLPTILQRDILPLITR